MIQQLLLRPSACLMAVINNYIINKYKWIKNNHFQNWNVWNNLTCASNFRVSYPSCVEMVSGEASNIRITDGTGLMIANQLQIDIQLNNSSLRIPFKFCSILNLSLPAYFSSLLTLLFNITGSIEIENYFICLVQLTAYLKKSIANLFFKTSVWTQTKALLLNYLHIYFFIIMLNKIFSVLCSVLVLTGKNKC
jgi:hypothetical protein